MKFSEIQILSSSNWVAKNAAALLFDIKLIKNRCYGALKT